MSSSPILPFSCPAAFAIKPAQGIARGPAGLFFPPLKVLLGERDGCGSPACLAVLKEGQDFPDIVGFELWIERSNRERLFPVWERNRLFMHRISPISKKVGFSPSCSNRKKPTP